jgi:hypothetical protein
MINHNKIMKNKLKVLLISISLIPYIVFALPTNNTQTPPNLNNTAVDACAGLDKTTVGGIVNFFSCTLIKSIVPLLFTLAVVGFIWGIIQYFLNPDNEEKRKAGKSFMIWGLIALFVMVSIWGLVGVLSNTFGINKTLLPQLSQ